MLMRDMREVLIARTACAVRMISAPSCTVHPGRCGLVRWWTVAIHRVHVVRVVRHCWAMIVGVRGRRRRRVVV